MEKGPYAATNSDNAIDKNPLAYGNIIYCFRHLAIDDNVQSYFTPKDSKFCPFQQTLVRVHLMFFLLTHPQLKDIVLACGYILLLVYFHITYDQKYKQVKRQNRKNQNYMF